MIIYFADRQLNIIGQASTKLPNGLVISGDKKTADVETGVSSFEFDITFDKETRSLVEECTQVGNYILRSNDGENELYSIIDAEIDTKKQEVYIYAEDDGMDLLNEIVGAYAADKAYPIAHYINKYAAGAGFVIGINEAKDLSRQLSWDGESTATERIASVATQFDGCEISFSFEVDGLNVVKKYINIYKERGKDIGVTLRLNQDIDSIVTTKSIANLATALQCVGGTINQESTILEATSSASPQVKYEVELETVSRTINTVQIKATVRAGLTSENVELGSDYGLKASIYMGGSWHSVTIKPTDKEHKEKWGDTTNHWTAFTFTISGVPAGVTTYSDIKFKVDRTDGKGGNAGVLASTSCGKYIIPNYIEGGENGEDINSRPITLDGYKYDDGDFYIDGNVLKSRKALQNWSRLVWKTEESQKAGGHITKQYSYDTFSQKTLCEKTITELKKLREMEVNYEVDITKFPDNVKIGDRINIVDDAGELYVSARVLKLEQSVADQEHKATLGEYLIKSSGISQKVAELAEQFAKNSVSAARALAIANNAKTAAADAQGKANAAVGSVQTAQQAAEAAQQAANAANESASDAQKKAAAAEQAVGNVVESVTGLETTVANAQAAAEQAQQAAQTAETKANEAKQAAVNAQTKANEAATAAGAAQEKADSATEKADTAKTTAEQAIADAEAAATTAAAAKQDAEQAQNNIDAFGENLTTLENTMTADYARKTDLTESEAHLQSQITQNAGLISSTVSMLSAIDETANDAADQAEKAQKRAEAARAEANKATADANDAQAAADQAAQAAADAQAEADIAKAAADTAQSGLDNAQAALDAAIADLETVQSRVDATEEEIAAAQRAVESAQAAANVAKVNADAAAKTAAEAQATADTAANSASEAQAAANTAASYAKIAQSVANESENAAAAQAAADDAAEEAAEAQRTANTAVSNAATAQAAADKAKQDAAAAQAAADDADAKAAQAANDLAAAQQNLANVTSRVDATAEEVAAAQQAVQTAQAAADKAKQDAQTAQSTADTAKANAATAQTAANNAKAAADQAQADATAAQQAADKAQADVDNLSVRVTTAETKITQNTEQIALMATKTEVTETLGGYYTKEQTDAAITVKSNEITQTVSREYATKQEVKDIEVGGRNLLKNSRNILLRSNNNDLYPAAYTDEEENGRQYRRYVRTETGAYKTTMSLYSGIPVTEITEHLTGKEVTFSFLVRCSHEINTTIMCAIVIDGTTHQWASNFAQNAIGTDWKRLSVTATIEQDYEITESNLLRFNPLAMTIPDGEIENFYLDVCEWKIEKGNKATDWTPAPEDVSSDITDVQNAADEAQNTASNNATNIAAAETVIQQLVDRINMLVRDSNGESLMQHTGDGVTWFFNTESIDRRLSENADGIKGLEDAADEAKKSADDVAQNLSAFEERFTASVYEDEPCIIFYELDSDRVQIITNTRRIFARQVEITNVETGEKEVAYADLIVTDFETARSPKMETRQLESEQSVSIGGWAWEKRSNGNLGLSWKGVVN